MFINTAAVENPNFIKATSEHFGSQSIVISIDVKKKLFGKYEVFISDGTKPTGLDPVAHAAKMEKLGAGEILINSIDRDGSMEGYDIDLTRMVANAVGIPVIACGGAGCLSDFIAPIKDGNASAVSAGSMFVFFGPRRSVLINYPKKEELTDIFQSIHHQ